MILLLTINFEERNYRIAKRYLVKWCVYVLINLIVFDIMVSLLKIKMVIEVFSDAVTKITFCHSRYNISSIIYQGDVEMVISCTNRNKITYSLDMWYIGSNVINLLITFVND